MVVLHDGCSPPHVVHDLLVCFSIFISEKNMNFINFHFSQPLLLFRDDAKGDLKAVMVVLHDGCPPLVINDLRLLFNFYLRNVDFINLQFIPLFLLLCDEIKNDQKNT
jgi:hypothetical protein